MTAAVVVTSDTVKAAASLLREIGWTCIPPVAADAKIPEPKVGQVWRSMKPRIEPRTIVDVGPHQFWPGKKCVMFTTPTRKQHERWKIPALHVTSWRVWAKKANARPENGE